MTLNQQKRAVVSSLMATCPTVRIVPNTPGVNIPARFYQAEYVDFRLGENAEVLGIPDLRLDDWGWSGTLSFQGVRHYCQVPWAACRVLYVQEPFVGPQVVWPAEQPSVVAANPPEAVEETEPSQAVRSPARGHLRIVK